VIGPRSRGSRFYLLQLVCVAVGLVLITAGQWRAGLVTMGATFCAGALARAVMPKDHLGMLRVRGRWFDIGWTTLLGVSLIVLAVIVPNQPD